jgi:diguanylate cyclase (GGDEF)-like protein
MFRVLYCLTTGHDPTLLAVAVVVCAATSIAALSLFAMGRQSTGRRRIAWAGLAGACGGTGIWSTHFIAMLAYNAGTPLRYDAFITAQSLLIAIAISSVGFAVAMTDRRHAPLIGGAIIGVAIAAMHFRGMRAIVVPGTLAWEEPMLIVSLLVGPLFAAASMVVVDRVSARYAVGLAAVFLVMAVCGLHSIAMTAVTVMPDPTIEAPAGMHKTGLAFAVTSVTLVVILCAVAAIAIQRAALRFEILLREQNALFQSAIHHLPVALSMFDGHQRLIMCNPAYRKMYDLSETGLHPGDAFSDIVLQHVAREQGNSLEAAEGARAWIAHHLNRLAAGNAFSEVLKLHDGRTIHKRVGPIEGGGWVDVQEDATSATHANEQIAWLARHDPLTGIANRLQFRERLEHQFATYQPSSPFALLWLDLDHFKGINDKLGHQVGDAFLQCVAQRLRGNLRAGDVAARLGGDEFAVLKMETPNSDAVTQFAERLLAVLREPFNVEGHCLCGSASIGIALAPVHGRTPDELFASADAALYAAKAKGGDVGTVYEANLREEIHAHPLASELAQGIQNREFILHYQPIVDLELGRPTGVEALMRWKHPRRGTIPPSEFIPLAEQTGLIVELGAWAIRQACHDAMAWPDEISVSVNLSTLQIESESIQEAVCDALFTSGLDPARLELEITETMLLRDLERSRKVLQRLHDMGVRIALDDFGTCFANLSYLRNLPLDTIKIDRTFVQDGMAEPGSLAILSAVADLARKLGMRSVAEGVETGGSLAAARQAGYQAAQGFYFSLPVPARAVPRALRRCKTKLAQCEIGGTPRAA